MNCITKRTNRYNFFTTSNWCYSLFDSFKSTSRSIKNQINKCQVQWKDWCLQMTQTELNWCCQSQMLQVFSLVWELPVRYYRLKNVLMENLWFYLTNKDVFEKHIMILSHLPNLKYRIPLIFFLKFFLQTNDKYSQIFSMLGSMRRSSYS